MKKADYSEMNKEKNRCVGLSAASFRKSQIILVGKLESSYTTLKEEAVKKLVLSFFLSFFSRDFCFGAARSMFLPPPPLVKSLERKIRCGKRTVQIL